LVYLIIGIFLAIGATYVYAAWNEAKTGDSGQLSQINWNSLVNGIHNKCGSNCDVKATAATASSNILTENNWNNLIDLVNNTLVDCTDDNGGKCFISQTSKSALDIDLVAANIKSGVTIFGVTSSIKGLGTACTPGDECASGYCVDGVCCNNACTGSTCQTCGAYSGAGAGTCGYVNNSSQDPDSECPGASGVCASTNCSGSDYSCGSVTTNWNAGTYNCTGSNQRCYSGSCITCGGWMNANYCWYEGLQSQSCNTACSTRGGVYGGNCDWVNDPADCSTCHGFSTHGSVPCDSSASYGPYFQWDISYPKCFFHLDGSNDCNGTGSYAYRQCACEK